MLAKAYGIRSRVSRKIIRRLIEALEGGEWYSLTLRDVFTHYHGVTVGAYSYGACFAVGQCDPKTSIGRYSSLARTVRIMNRNHPLDFASSHAFFFNSACGHVRQDCIEYAPITIGNDVWIGHNAIILPSVAKIGNGAVIGAGTVLTHSVPPYALVVGNPGRVVRLRFDESLVEALLASAWWEKPIDALDIERFTGPYAPPIGGKI